MPAPTTQPATSVDEVPEIVSACEEAAQLIRDGRYERAIEILEKLPPGTEAPYYRPHFLRAQIHYRQGRLTEAHALAASAWSLRPKSADVNFLLGRICTLDGRAHDATAYLRTATLAAEKEPNNPSVTAAWFRLGELLQEEGYLTAAAQAFDRFDMAVWETHTEHRHEPEVAVILRRHPYGAIELRLQVLDDLGATDAAVATAAQAAATRPDDPHLARLYAARMISADRAQEAYEYCRSRVEAAGSNDALLATGLQAAQTAGTLEQWLRDIERGLAERGETARAARVADHLDALDEHEAALRMRRRIVAVAPDDADAHWGLAASLRASGDLKGALEALAAFVRAHPASAEAPVQRVAGWMESFDEADRFLQLVPGLAEAAGSDFAMNFVLGATAAAAEQAELARQLLQTAVDQRPDFALGHVVWGRMALAQFRWSEARQHAQAALEQEPQSASAALVLAEAHAGLDENEEAEAAFKSALRRSPHDPAFALALARFYRRMGNTLGEQRYFQQALTLDPANAEAAENLIESYVADGKFDVAASQAALAEAADLPADVLRRIRTSIRYARGYTADEYLEELARQHAEHPNDTVTALKIAAGELQLRDRPDEALPLLRAALQRAPENEQALGLLAQAQIRRLEYPPAIEILQALATRYPNRIPVLETLAETLLNDFQPDAARKVLRDLLTLVEEPRKKGEYQLRLLATYYDFQDYDGALAALQELTGNGFDAELAERARRQILLDAGRFEEGVRLATERLDAEPTDTDRRAEFFDACTRAKRYDDCVARLEQLQTQQPADPELSELIARAHLAADRPAQALSEVDDFAAADIVVEQRMRRLRAICNARLDRLDDALLELDDLLADIETFFGTLDPVLRQQNQRRRQDLRFAVRQTIVQLLTEAGEFEQAFSRCAAWADQVTAEDPLSQFEAYQLSYAAYQAAGNDEGVIQVGEKLLEVLPDDAGINNDLGYTLVDQGREIERATRMIRKAVVQDPRNSAYLDSLGWAYYKAGDFANARTILARVTQLRRGQDPVLFDHLADSEFRLGNTDSARRHWRRAVALLEEDTGEIRPARDVRLLGRIRAKLEALQDSSVSPQVAPTAAEQEAGR